MAIKYHVLLFFRPEAKSTIKTSYLPIATKKTVPSQQVKVNSLTSRPFAQDSSR